MRAYQVTCEDCDLTLRLTTSLAAEQVAAHHLCTPPAERQGQCVTCDRRGVMVSPNGTCRLCRVRDLEDTLPPRPSPVGDVHTCRRCGDTLPGLDRDGRLGYCRDCVHHARRDGLVSFPVGRPRTVTA